MKKKILVFVLLCSVFGQLPVVAMKRKRTSDKGYRFSSNKRRKIDDSLFDNNDDVVTKKKKSRSIYYQYLGNDEMFHCPHCSHFGKTISSISSHFSRMRHGHLKDVPVLKRKKPKKKERDPVKTEGEYSSLSNPLDLLIIEDVDRLSPNELRRIFQHGNGTVILHIGNGRKITVDIFSMDWGYSSRIHELGFLDVECYVAAATLVSKLNRK